MKEAFIEKSFRPDRLKIIEQANEIIAEYQRQGFKLTLRQLYYQFVRRIWIENKQSEYKRLGDIVNDGRMTGLIDWAAIEDRTRNLEDVTMWSSPTAILEAVANQYKENPWFKQDRYIEVWIEKEALVGVIEPVCTEFRVSYLACRGYTSASEIYDAGKRLAKKRFTGRDHPRHSPLVLYLGDHDPSGLDMDRSNAERTALFGRMDVEFRRLALNMAQVDEYSPPPNPAKDTDARFEGYRAEYGDDSWELDALEPQVISDLIRTELEGEIDPDAWAESMKAEERNRKGLVDTAVHWDDVLEFLGTHNEEDDDENS